MLRWSAVLMGVVASMVFAGVAGADQTFPDREGDASVGSDLVSAVVSNDTSGQITMNFNTKFPLPSNHAIQVFIDADTNINTGQKGTFGGYDYVMFAFPSGGAIFKWDPNGSSGAGYYRYNAATFKLQTAGATEQFSINRSELGNTGSFSFFAITYSIDGAAGNVWDRIPDSGLGTYTLSFPATLTVQKNGTGSGSVADATSAINCGATCTATLTQGQQVTLSATADPGSVFAGWGGACSGTSITCTLTLSADATVTATFSKKPAPKVAALTVHKLGRGIVTSTPAGIACGARCAARIALGPVTLTAKPAAGSTFSHWGGACHGTKLTCRFNLAHATAVTAVFTKR
jgi:Divergent InlB B-repeat domain